MTDSKKIDPFLSDDFLRGLDQLQILTRKKIKGLGLGNHLTWKSGGNLEFLDYRKYQPGDDLRYVDWNVYGRLDRLFIKLFHAEKDMELSILMDTSRSMMIGNPPKHIHAKKIAAALGYIGLNNQDKVGISTFNDSISLSKPADKGLSTYPSLVDFLRNLTCQGQTDLAAAMEKFSITARHHGVLVIISDLLDPGGFEKGLQFINRKRYDVIVIQVLDRTELAPEIKGHLNLVDIENGESKKTVLNADLIERYRNNMTRRIEAMNNYCLENSAIYVLTETQQPFEEFLVEFLADGTIVV